MACIWSFTLQTAASSLLDLPKDDRKPSTRISRNKMRKNRDQTARRQRESTVSPDQMIQTEIDQLTEDAATYALLIRRCGRARAVREGRKLHASIFKTGHDKLVRLQNLLIQMYGECGDLRTARRVFDDIPNPNIFSWNIMLAAYTQNGRPREALQMSQRMPFEGMLADRVTYVILLHACSQTGALREGRIIHAGVVASRLETNVVTATAVIDMYGKCGSVRDASMAFDKIPPSRRDIVAWNAMISAYALNGYGRHALELLRAMEECSCRPDPCTYVGLLDACSGMNSLEDGRSIHARIVSDRLDTNVIVGTALVSMYGKCGCLSSAVSVFNGMMTRSPITWTAMLGGYARAGHTAEALRHFERMKTEDIMIDVVSYTIAVDACAALKDFAKGREIHMEIEFNRVEVNEILAYAVVNMYSECGKVEFLRNFVLRQRNTIMWNALISSYNRVENKEAVKLYIEMSARGVKPDRSTFVAVLSACGSIQALAEGRMIHTHVISSCCDSDPVVAAALAEMYGKCRSLSEAVSCFQGVTKKNSVVLWTTMIGVYGDHQEVDDALRCFSGMLQRGLEPNELTFVSVLLACSRSGCLEQALTYFRVMVHDCDIRPQEAHYNIVVDLLSRSGKLGDAFDLVQNMPFVPTAPVWMCLLSAARAHRDVDIGRHAGEKVFEAEPKNALAYLVLGKLYAEVGLWDEVVSLKKLMEDRGLKRDNTDG